MNFFSRLNPVSVSLSPNTERDDFFLALFLLFRPWKWKRKPGPVLNLEEKLKSCLQVKNAFAFNSGRSAFQAILKSLQIGRKDEVLIQSFTCTSAVSPILETGARPIFVDLDETINLDPEDLRKKITSNSKAIVVQHTFGWPAEIEEILKIADENSLWLIEDCAHSLGAEYGLKKENGYVWQKTGTFGKAAFFSFGRDKIISSVFGGAAVTDDEELALKIKSFQQKLDYPSFFWIFQQLLHPLIMNSFVLPFYGLNQYLGRFFLGGLHKLSLLSKAVYKKEKEGKMPSCFPKKMPESLALLALNQFGKLERFNEHRRKMAAAYRKELEGFGFSLPLPFIPENKKPVFMRYPVLTEKDSREILEKARKKKIYLNDGWRKSPINPAGSDLEKLGYSRGSCPKAEEIAGKIINLPTHIRISPWHFKKLVSFLKNF
jgi:perosamine synthetase